MPLPLVGAQAVLAGMPQFNKDADTMNSKIGGIHQKMGGLGGVARQAGNLVSSAFSTMVKGAVGAGAAVTAIGGGILKLGYDAANLPGIQSVFNNMTTSMGVDAEALMGKMRAASYGAVKDFDLMKQANKAMVGAGEEFGKMFAESLPTLMQVSREAAKAQGLSVEYMYDSIVTGVKRMSPMILDNLGFQISLGEAQEKYAAKIGKTSAELSKAEKQMALLTEVMRLGTEMVEQSGGHIDSVRKDVDSWKTALMNVKDRIGIELLPVLQKFMDIMGKPSQGMQDAIVNTARNFVQSLLPAIDSVANAMSMLVNGPLVALVRGFAGIGSKGLGEIFKGIGSIFTGDTSIDFSDFFTYMTDALAPALGEDLAMKIAGFLADAAETLRTALGPIRDAVNEFVDFIGPRLDILTMYFKMSIGEIGKILQGGSIKPLLDILKASIQVVFGIETATKILDWADKFKQAAIWIRDHSDIILGALGSIAILLAGQKLTAGWSAMSKAASLALGGVGKSLTGLITPLGVVGLAVAGLGVAWQLNLFGIQDKVKEMVPVVTAAFDDIKGKILNVAEVVSDAGILSPEAWEALSAIVGEDLATSFQNALTSILPFIDTVRTIIDSLMMGNAANYKAGGFGLIMTALFGDNETTDSIATAVESVMQSVTGILNQLSVLFTNVFNTILAVSQAVWPSIQIIIQTVWDAISQVLMTVITVIIPALISGFLGILTWVNDNWPVIQNVIVTVFQTIYQIIATVISEVVPFVIEKFQQIVGWVQENWPAIQETIGLVLNFIWEMIQNVLNAIATFWQEHGDAVLSIITLAWNYIKQTVDTVIHLIQDIITLVMSIIRGDWEKVWTTILDILKTIWNQIKLTVDTVINLVKNIMEVAWGLIKATVQIVWDQIKLIIETVWNSIKDIIDTALKAAAKLIVDQLNALKNDWERIWNGIGDIVKNVWNSIIGYICGGLNSAIDLINGLISAANKLPGINIPELGGVDCSTMMLAKGGILNRPTFVAGEAGAEVVAPLGNLMNMIRSSLINAVSDIAYRDANRPYSGPVPGNTYNYGGNTYVREYNLTTQSIARPGGLAIEFKAMELAHA